VQGREGVGAGGQGSRVQGADVGAGVLGVGGGVAGIGAAEAGGGRRGDMGSRSAAGEGRRNRVICGWRIVTSVPGRDITCRLRQRDGIIAVREKDNG
jgi:hypothetical protein